MENNVCYNCFNYIPAGSAACPYCGYDPSGDSGRFPLALPAGSALGGKYVVGRVLGQGGFGITYVALDYSTKQRVAIKEFFPDTMAARTGSTAVHPNSRDREEGFAYGKQCFLEEAKTLAEFIGDPNIVMVHSYFEENGTAYFVMDYVEGESLQSYVRKYGGKIGWRAARNLMYPVMRALAAVHAKGIVHRDVTPDNIFITKDGTIKLLDFGAARYSIGDRSRSLDVVLKHGFAPKEQYTRHGRQGAFTDVYATAASMYYITAGRLPPDSIDRLETDDLIPPSALGVEIPPAEEDALLKALAVQPADRFSTMNEFMAALEAASNPQPQQTGYTQPINFGQSSQPRQTGFSQQSGFGQSPQPQSSYSAQGMFNTGVPAPQFPQQPAQPAPAAKKSRLPVVIAAVVLIGGGVALTANLLKNKDEVKPDKTTTTSAAAAAASTETAAAVTTASSDDPEPETSITKKNDITDSISISKHTDGTVTGYKLLYDGYDATGTYTGSLNGSGVPDGEGVFEGEFTDDDGDLRVLTYTGGFVNGEMTGSAICHETCNEEIYDYDGELVSGQKYGNGTYVLQKKDGRVVTERGTWKNGELEGSGEVTISFSDGSLLEYAGEFSNGNVNGNGSYKLTYADGTYNAYEGGWKNEKRSGKGREEKLYDDGQRSVYEGDFENDARNGTGKITVWLPDGEVDTYEGSWKDGARSGSGTYTWKKADGEKSVYTGEWVNGDRNGEGKLKTYFTDGATYVEKGTFKDSAIYTGKKIWYDKEGTVTTKENYKDGKLTG